MRIRRLIPALVVCLAAPASISVAQPKGAPAPAPGGEEVQMSEDAPPSDLEGRDENPDAPKILGVEPPPPTGKPAAPRPTGYPIEEPLRPITLPKNMVEISTGPRVLVSPFQSAMALRARYGLTEKVQLGLTYMLAGVYDELGAPKKWAFHPGKAVGVEVTVLLKEWVGVRVGVPMYIDPFAMGLELGAPMKWQLAGGKYAIGALDDLFAVRLSRFVPSFEQEKPNADAAAQTRPGGSNTLQSRGELRFSAYGSMQYGPKTALLGRTGFAVRDFSTTATAVLDNSGLRYFLRAGVQHTPRKHLDVAFSIGFEDLGDPGTFGPAVLVAFRL
jgi:hypothetical protein